MTTKELKLAKKMLDNTYVGKEKKMNIAIVNDGIELTNPHDDSTIAGCHIDYCSAVCNALCLCWYVTNYDGKLIIRIY